MKYIILFILVSCATVPSNVSISPEQKIKSICYNFSGKSRIELGDHSYVASAESIVENKHWKFALTFPLYGEELLDMSWEDFKREGLVMHGGVRARLLNGFKDYIEKNNVTLDPQIIIKLLGYNALIVKTLAEQKNYLAKCSLKSKNAYTCPLELPQSQGVISSHWLFDSQQITITLSLSPSLNFKIVFFAEKEGFFHRITLSMENQKYFTQEIFVNSCAAL